jgi:hypothetical protein
MRRVYVKAEVVVAATVEEAGAVTAATAVETGADVVVVEGDIKVIELVQPWPY